MRQCSTYRAVSDVVVSTDASIENRHFKADWLTPEEIGYRAVTAALSDLAAMAANPIAILWAVESPGPVAATSARRSPKVRGLPRPR